MNFRDYASKIRTQAKDAVSRIDLPQKLPTFDDMAAKDEYIHSDDFNVTGINAPKPKGQQQPYQDQEDPVHPGETSSAGSWSLLDQSVQNAVHPNEIPKQDTVTGDVVASRTHQTVVVDGESEPNDEIPAGPVPVMLSVVADTLSEQDSNFTSAATSLRGDDDEMAASLSSSGTGSEHSEAEDDDPIFQLMQRDQNSNSGDPKAQGRRQKRMQKDDSKQQHRFFDQLEKRMNTPQTSSQTTTQSNNNTSTSTRPIGTNSDPLPTQNRMKNFFQKMVPSAATASIPSWMRGGKLMNSTAPSQKAAPLDQFRRQEQKPSIQSEEIYTTVSSSAILSEDERKSLARVRDLSFSPTKWLHENRRFFFVLFTLLFSGYVYHRTRQL